MVRNILRGLPLLVVALVVFVARPVSAQLSWAVAQREPAEIQSLVGKLEPFVEKLPGQESAPAVILFSQVQTRVEGESAEMCRNLLIQLQSDEPVADHLASPWVGPKVEVTSLEAFVLRDGEVRKLAETARRFEPGPAESARGRCILDWGELREGDVIGWSWVGKLEQNLPAFTFPVADVYPCVIASLTIDGGGEFFYEVSPVGFPRSELSLKQREVVQGKPSLWKASVNAQPAIEIAPVGPPYPDAVPHIALDLSEIWIEPESGPVQPQWIPFGGWNTTMVSFSQALEAAVEEAGNLSIQLTAITTGKTTQEAKVAAVFEHVRDKIGLLEGPRYSPLARRDPENLVSAKEATPAEKAMMMAVMLRKLDIPASLALLQTPAHGTFDEERETWLQFDQVVVRVGGMDDGTFHAPQCADCPAGTLPEEWKGGTALITAPDVLELAKEFGEEQNRVAMTKGSFDVGAMTAERQKQPWHRVVEIGD